jgi:hypothetical protein
MTKKTPHCKGCGEDGHYAIQCRKTARKPIQVNKPIKRSQKRIKQKGDKTIVYENWRDTIARPFLIKRDGEICQICFGTRCGNRQLDVAHILGRGGHHEHKMDINNVRLVGRNPCHREETDHQVNGKFVPNNPHKFRRNI